MTRFVLRPAQATAATAGPKAAVLARALAVGLPVPPFVVVSADAYRQHVSRAGVRAVDPAATRAAITGTALAFDLGMQLTAALQRLEPPLAVRSSGTAEDLPGLSFAGQYATTLGVDAEELDAAVLACWASVWGDRAVAYREHNGVSHDRAAMAVIVQRMVEADLGGVAFTTDPVSGKRDVVVESSAAGAEAIVSGRVAPERASFKRKELKGDPPEPLSPASVPAAVARLALAAEELLDAPADIEWAFDGEQLWLLQARPITAVAGQDRKDAPAAPAYDAPIAPTTTAKSPPPAAAPAAPSATPAGYRPTAWSNVNTGEVLPGVVTPMTWSVVGKVATGLIDALFGKLGIRVDTDRLTTLIAGRAYFNASLIGSAFEQIPMRGDADITSVFGGSDAPPGFTDLPLAPEDTAHVSTLRLVAGVPLVAVYFLRHSPRAAARLCARVRTEAAAALSGIAAASSEDALAALTDRVVHSLDTMVDAIAFSGVAMALHGQFVASAKKHFGEDGPALANTLLAGQGGVASAESGLALARLSRLGREDRAVGEALRSSASWAEVRMRLEEAGEDGYAFHEAWAAFLAEHGHHARGELEFGSPRWAECPDDVLAMVVGLLDIPMVDDIISAHEARGQRAAEEQARALRTLGPLARVRFRWLLKRARAGARMRENLKNEGVRMLAAGRQALLALGASMAERGVFAGADDILFLTWDEVAPVRAGTLEAAPVVAERRNEYDANCAITPPPVVIGEWDGEPHTPDLATPFEPDTFTGLGVAAGVARGPARVICSLQSAERVLPGEVLVAPFTDPGWTPYFIPAAAIVVDMGGMLSHGSIIAREYGIPGVVNVGPATTLINTGDIVEVDGSRGVVTVLERVEKPAG
ncbi:MAG: PEP/pyruvate-binding domain-containing protein [Coriobacteriia bacterium]|nr:PEP/pyruvate-binding domain-containing protein [Coriobacteriia bacterium]